MKYFKIKSILLLIFIFTLLTGCSQKEKAADKMNESLKTTGETQSEENILEDDKQESEKSLLSEKDNQNPEENILSEKDSKDKSSGEIIDITEKMYVTYINDIYVNKEDYLGKTVKIEGMFKGAYYDKTDTTYYYVYRVGPGCCGNDGSMCGFEFTYDGEMPKDNDWIKVIGVLDSYEEDGAEYLTIRATSVEVMDERGAETVSLY